MTKLRKRRNRLLNRPLQLAGTSSRANEPQVLSDSWQLEVCCTTKLRNVSLLRENRFESLQYIQLESDSNGKLKAKAKLNFAKCLSHPSCLLISSAISFSFSCLLFSQLLTVLQVNVLSYPLFLSNFSYIFSLFHYYSWIPTALDEAGLSTSRNENKKHAKSFPYAVFPKTSGRRFMIFMLCLNLFQNNYISKRLEFSYITPTCYLTCKSS